MKLKLSGSVFVLAVALGIVSVAVRSKSDPAPELRPADSLARPLASYRVSEVDRTGTGIDYRGAGYTARVAEEGFRFGSKDFRVEMGAPRIEQGALSLECAKGAFSRPAFGVGRLDRGAVVEEYIFENGRVEQLFRFPRKLAEGALRVRIPVATNPPAAQVVAHGIGTDRFEEAQFLNGGLSFRDAAGATKLAYHTAVVVDAEDRRLALLPRHENGEIVLEVPAAFMAQAAYPVVVDPWLELAGSGSGGGITGTTRVSDRPSIAIEGGGNPYISWADDSSGNFEIYMKYWNGFDFKDLGGASFGAGISGNAGRSVNPSIALDSAGQPYIAWQDETSGNLEIFFKQWDSPSLSWKEHDLSGQVGGISKSQGISQHPSVAVISVTVPFPAPARSVQVPLVAWQDTSAGSEIMARFFYPGDPGSPPGVPPIPAGWVSLGGSGTFAGISSNPGVSEHPSLVVDSAGRPTVAWHDTTGGNYEIYLRRFSVAMPYSVGIGGTAGTWDEIDGSGTGGGISATADLSQYPSLAVAGTTFYVAWQEAVAGNNEIYLRRAAAAGTWGEVGASATGGGISRTAGSSIFPSLGLGGTPLMAVVAWSDDTSGNPEIYVRQIDTVTPTAAWIQVGQAGSAALVVPELVGPTGGISATTSLSMTPSLKVNALGSPIVAWSDGASGAFDVYLKMFSPNGPTNLRQVDPSTLTDIAAGGTTNQTTIQLRAILFSELPATLRLQVEVRPSGTPFTGTVTTESGLIPDGTEAVVSFSGLPNTDYSWRARTVDSVGKSSPWISFAGTDTGIDYRVNSAAAGGPPNPSIVTEAATEGKDKCGLLGAELLLILGALALRRRRR